MRHLLTHAFPTRRSSDLTVGLDKTGTLTYGEPEVQSLVVAPGAVVDDVLRLMASAELRSEHPLGKTLVRYVRAQGVTPVEPEAFQYTPGLGISATVNGERILVGNAELLRKCVIALPEELLKQQPAAAKVWLAHGDAWLTMAMLDQPIHTRTTG